MSFNLAVVGFIGLLVAIGTVAYFQPQRYVRDLRLYLLVFVVLMLLPNIYNAAIERAIAALLDSELPREYIVAAVGIVREQEVDQTFWLLLSSVFLLYVFGLEWYAKARVRKAEALAAPADSETSRASQYKRSAGQKPPR